MSRFIFLRVAKVDIELKTVIMFRSHEKSKKKPMYIM